MSSATGDRVLVIGAGLAGLAAAERLLDAGIRVTVIDAFPVPGGRTASFDVSMPVAGLIAGDVVEHGLHAWFQHYSELFGLMERAGVERYLHDRTEVEPIVQRVLRDLEPMFPGQIRNNRVLRSFLHTREGIIACRPGVWARRPPQYIGSPHFVLAGDWTRQSWGTCMEGAVRSGQMAASALLSGRQPLEPIESALSRLVNSVRSAVGLIAASRGG